MRRQGRRVEQDNSMKNILYLLGTILGISIIAFIITFVTYDNNSEQVNPERIAEIVSNTTKNENTEQASTQISKTIEEVKEEALEVEQQINKVGVFDDTEDNKKEENTNTQEQIQETSTQSTEPIEPKKLEFITPVSGETTKEFAKDTLVYSNTLKEWVVHLGVDIQAEKTTVVKASEDGEVTSIKTDPRYGITVIIKHNDGFETRYANLLTAEYVKEGEKVEKGQTIGTVGNTGAFEIADNPHLHFEMLKNNEYVNPTLYIK